MDRFQIDFEVKFADGAEDGTFSGYGSVFGNEDLGGDLIKKGAFKKTLADWGKKGKLPKMLLQHGGFLREDVIPIGKWTRMEEDSKGLYVEGRLIAMDTDRIKGVYAAMREGELDGLSIGYKARKFSFGTKPSEPYRTIEELDLAEVSVVLFGMNEEALINNVKAGDLINPRELERELKTLFSTNDAVKAVAIVKKHLQREAEGHPSTTSRDEDAAMELLDTLKKLRAV